MIFAPPAESAMLYFEPAEEAYSRADIFLVKVRVDNEGECLNAFGVEVNYDNSLIRAIDFAVGDSIISLWVEPPKIDHENGKISFAGGVPGGYCGRVSGDPGLTNVLGTIVFQVPAFRVGGMSSIEAEISFSPGTEIRLSDGLGTLADLKTREAIINITERDGAAINEWGDVVGADKVPPEPFEIILDCDPGRDGLGECYIIFNTTDKQSGISHYEVKESDENGFVRSTNREAQWRKATSPYKLIDQTLQSVIQVKAVDKAGNVWIATFDPIGTETSETSWEYAILSVLVLIIIGVIIVWLWRKKIISKKRQINDDETGY